MASNEEYSISGLSETGSGAAAPSVDGGDSKHLAHSAQSNGLKELDTLNFPDGGARAWWVAAGNGGVMFCTLGFINTFGYVPTMTLGRLRRCRSLTVMVGYSRIIMRRISSAIAAPPTSPGLARCRRSSFSPAGCLADRCSIERRKGRSFKPPNSSL